MRDLIDWLPTRTRVFLIVALVALVCAAGLGGALLTAASHPKAPQLEATQAIPTPTPARWRTIWSTKGEGNQLAGPVTSLAGVTPAPDRLLLVWSCLASPKLPNGGTYLNLIVVQGSVEWPEAGVLCPTYGDGAISIGNGVNSILTIASFQIKVSSNTRWTLDVKVPTTT